MTTLTLRDFFNGRIEQEVLEPVVILPIATRGNTGVITLPTDFKWIDFEYIEGAIGVGTSVVTSSAFSINKTVIMNRPTNWAYSDDLTSPTPITWRLDITATGNNTASWVGQVTGGSVNVYPQFLIGYRRRLSSVGLDELMSSMGLPNLCANADLSINQRNFDGNWSSLAIGSYGYDQWMKVSDTHMAYVIEEGFYKPNSKYTVTKDDVLIGEFTSPASGHFAVSVPFATSGKFDIYMGQFKRPWHPVQDGLSRCQRYYQKGVDAEEYITSLYKPAAPFGSRGVIHLPTELRKTTDILSVTKPRWYSASAGTWITSGSDISLLQRSPNSIRINLSYNSVGTPFQSVIVSFGFTADASITLAELNNQIIGL